MTKIYSKSEGHKKILVPVIALLLCATALIGAGYAALAASTATSSNNSLGGEVIILDLGKVDGDGEWITSITADTKFTYFSQSKEGDIKYYVGTDDVKIGAGTLTVNGSNYTGSAIKLNKAVDVNIEENNSLKNQVSMYVKFTDAAADENVNMATIENKIASFDFEVYISFNGIEGEVTQVNADNEVETKNAIFLSDNTNLNDLIAGFDYKLIFSAYIVESID